MELTTLRQFRAIARAGHMTRAARELGVSQPALSAMIKKLESELGVDLLHRSRRGVEPTEAGRVFLAFAEEALLAAESGVRAVRQLAGLEAGSIRVGAGATAAAYLLPPVVSSLRRKHPGLRFYVRETGSSAVVGAVLSGELDLGIVTLPVHNAAPEDVLVIPLVEDELRLIVPGAGRGEPPQSVQRIQRGTGGGKRGGKAAAVDGSPSGKSAQSWGSLIGAKAFRWKELEGVPFVGFEAGAAVREVIDGAAKAAGVTLDVVMELRSIEGIKSMVAAGIGVGLVSRLALKPGEGLTCRDGKLARTLAIVRRNDRVPSAAAALFERELRGK